MKGTSRQPEFSLELIAYALRAGQSSRMRHPSQGTASSFPEKGDSQLSYFRHMLPDGKGYPTVHFPQACSLPLTEARVFVSIRAMAKAHKSSSSRAKPSAHLKLSQRKQGAYQQLAPAARRCRDGRPPVQAQMKLYEEAMGLVPPAEISARQTGAGKGDRRTQQGTCRPGAHASAHHRAAHEALHGTKSQKPRKIIISAAWR